MGVLTRAHDDRRHTLGARVIVGRAAACHIRVDDPLVSAEHASIYYRDGVRMVRDLGSTNGTFVEGSRLAPGEKRPLEPGATLWFGADATALVFLVTDCGPPAAAARHLASGTLHRGVHGLLQLPAGNDPRVSVYDGGDGGWVLESDGEPRRVLDQELIEVDGEAFRLELPPTTSAVTPATTEKGEAMAQGIDHISLRFRVSRDEEYVELSLGESGKHRALPPRSFHYLLLTLARRRLDERTRTDLSVEEQGWVYADELADMLGTTRTKLNLDVCRARQQLADEAIEGAGRLIERRATTRQIRIGVTSLAVEAL